MILAVGAAGNQDTFSCSLSPANSGFTLSVAGTGKNTELPLHGSNYGDCIDIYAPGEDVMAPFIGPSNTEHKPLTGSSAAAAVVSGIAARVLHAVATSDVFSKRYEETIVQADGAPFLKRVLTSSRVAGYYENKGPHAGPYRDCDIVNGTALTSILKLELRPLENTGEDGEKVVIAGIEGAKKRFLAMKHEKAKTLLEKSL